MSRAQHATASRSRRTWSARATPMSRCSAARSSRSRPRAPKVSVSESLRAGARGWHGQVRSRPTSSRSSSRFPPRRRCASRSTSSARPRRPTRASATSSPRATATRSRRPRSQIRWASRRIPDGRPVLHRRSRSPTTARARSRATASLPGVAFPTSTSIRFRVMPRRGRAGCSAPSPCRDGAFR